MKPSFNFEPGEDATGRPTASDSWDVASGTPRAHGKRGRILPMKQSAAFLGTLVVAAALSSAQDLELPARWEYSPPLISPEARDAVNRLISAGWTVTNQHVFTAAASRRGHAAKLRQVLNEIGVLTYYNFSVKGYMENSFNFAPVARNVQEQIEEKYVGFVPAEHHDTIRRFPLDAELLVENIAALRRSAK